MLYRALPMEKTRAEILNKIYNDLYKTSREAVVKAYLDSQINGVGFLKIELADGEIIVETITNEEYDDPYYDLKDFKKAATGRFTGKGW